VWVTRSDDSGDVTRVDPQSNAVVSNIHVGPTPNHVRVVDGLVWVAVEGESYVARIDPATDEVVDRIDVGKHPADIAVEGGRVWVTNNEDGTVSRIDL
jgi:virginiamycin B lyase